MNKFIKGVLKGLDAGILDLLANSADIEPERLETGHDTPGLIQILIDRDRYFSVIQKGVECFRRNRIDGLRTDQFFNVKYIAVSRTFRAGAGP